MIKNFFKYLSPKYQTLFLDYTVDMRPRYGHGRPPHKGLNEIINAHRGEYAQLMELFLQYQDSIAAIQPQSLETNIDHPTWNNGFLPGLDIIALYAMVAHFRPKRYIEVGSGHSTKVVNRSRKDNALSTEVISIDPMPRAEIDHLADQIIRCPFENADHKPILELEANDILFIDNSHRIFPNSDAMVFFLEILPQLKSGVIVHIHDIYLPYDYPDFMCERYYNEQYGLAMFLLANPLKYRTLLPNYFISQDEELSQILSPFWSHKHLAGVERHGGSYWLQISE